MTDPITFDILDVLNGRTYPTDKVYIPFDEDAVYRIAEARPEVGRLKAELIDLTNHDASSEEIDAARAQVEKAETELEELRERINKSTYTFEIQGIPSHEVEAIQTKVEDRYKGEQTDDKRSYAKQKYDLILNWEAYIQRIVDPNGAVDEDITEKRLYGMVDKLPTYGQFALVKAISELAGTTVKEYENVVKDLDFLYEA